MKTKLLFAFIGFTLIFYSCDKDESDYKNSSDAMRKYFDMFSPSTWISVTDKDSIKLELGYWRDTFYTPDIYIQEYEIINNVKKYKKSEFYPSGYVYGNTLKIKRYYPDEEQEYKFSLNNDKLTLYKFRNDQDYTFDREFEKSEYPSNEILFGEWTSIMSKDSVTLVFENGMEKEYVYDKITGQTLKYTTYEEYRLRRTVRTLKGVARNEDKIWLYNNNKIVDISRYELSDNKLIIYKNGNGIVYVKKWLSSYIK